MAQDNLIDKNVSKEGSSFVFLCASGKPEASYALAGAPPPMAKDRKIADDKKKAIKDAIDKFKCLSRPLRKRRVAQRKMMTIQKTQTCEKEMCTVKNCGKSPLYPCYVQYHNPRLPYSWCPK